jgi:uncharacterized protein YdhG (YjbR/CyaY superfamily)
MGSTTAKKAAATSTPAAEAVDDYLSKVTDRAREMLGEIRAIVLSMVPPEAVEIFSYGLPGFYYKGVLLSYGAYKNHCGFYPGSPPLLNSLAEELKDYKTARGSVQFPYDKPLPEALVRKIVRARIAENEARSG